jgi:anti-sigma factor RsiW
MSKQGAALGVNVKPDKTDQSREVACGEFLARHSDYLDGLLSPVASAQLSAHAVACASCARYERIVRKGIDLVRDLPDAETSDDFEMRLQHRIFHLEDARTLHPRASGATAALGVAAAIALLAWSPLLVGPADREVAVSPAFEQTPDMARDEYRAVPLFSQSAWYPMTMPAAPTHQPSALLAAFPGPYSPLVVTPPAHRSVRRVSTEYVSND